MQGQGCASDARKKDILLQNAPFSRTRWDLTRPVRPVGAQNAQPHTYKCNQVSNSWVKPKMKQVQNFKDNSESSKAKHRTCYTCREKGHLDKDCPKGNLPNSNLVRYDFAKLRQDQVGTCAIRVIDSPRTSIRAIWVPKHLVSNLYGPNKA